TNCGARLFGALNDDRNASQVLRGIGLNPNAVLGRGRAIRGGDARGRAIQVARNAQIPPPGTANPGRRDRGVRDALSGSGNILVRADGYSLRSEVPLDRLSAIRRNPDMDGGVLISDDGAALSLLGSTNLAGVVVRGKEPVRLNRTRELSSADRRRVSRALAGSGSPTERAQRAVAASGGALSTGSLKGDDPATAAAKRLDRGGDPMSLRAPTLGQAIDAAKTYKRSKVNDKVTLYTKGKRNYYVVTT